jgi:hypothetical protein
MIGAGLAGKGGLGRRRYRADHFSAADFCDLAQENAAAAGGGMHKAARRRSERKSRGREIVRGEALEQNRRGFFKADLVGQRYDPLCGRKRMGSVTARSEDEDHAIADGDMVDIGADGFNDAGAFEPERQGQVAFVKSAAQLRVEEIDAGGFHGGQNLAVPGRRQRQILERHRFGAAAGMNTHGFHCTASEMLCVIGCTA